MGDNKYAKYVLPAPIMQVPLPGYTQPSIYVHEGELPADVTFGFHYIKEPYSEGKPHTHPGHEFLFFVGGDPEDINSFDAEIQIALGDEGEVQTITAPSVVSIPPGLVHSPLTFKRLDKPVFFIEVSLMAEGKYVSTNQDGTDSPTFTPLPSPTETA